MKIKHKEEESTVDFKIEIYIPIKWGHTILIMINNISNNIVDNKRVKKLNMNIIKWTIKKEVYII